MLIMDSGGGTQDVLTGARFQQSDLLKALSSIRAAGSLTSTMGAERHDTDISAHDVDRVHIPPPEAQARPPATEPHQTPSGKEEVRRILQLWSEEVNSGSKNPAPLHYVFKHKYPETNISLQGLEPADLDVVQDLQDICAELDFDLFFNTLEKKEDGIVRHASRGPEYLIDTDFKSGDEARTKERTYFDLVEVLFKSYRSNYVLDLNGNKLASIVTLDEKAILQENPFGNEPDEKDYETCWKTGLQGTHWYRVSALAIVPRDGTVSFLTPTDSYVCYNDFWSLCDYFITKSTNFPGNSRFLSQLHEFLRANSENRQFKKPLCADHLQKVLQLSIHGHEPGLLDLVLSQNHQAPPIEFFHWIKEEYTKSTIPITEFRKLFIYATRLQPSICQQHEAFSAVKGNTDTSGEMQDIISQVVDECLRIPRKRELYGEEGPAILNLSLCHRDFNHLKAAVIPLVEERGESTAFVLGFLTALNQSIKHQQVPQDEAQPMYERIAQLALRRFEPTSITAIKYRHENEGVWWCSRGKSHQQHITPDSMLEFVTTLIALKLDSHLALLANKIDIYAESIKGKEFHPLWIPFLQGLFPIFEQHKVALPSSHWTQIYQSLLQAYLRNYVQKQPPQPHLSRQWISCSCGDCTNLNRFLASPAEGVGRFPMSKMRRLHLHNMLDMAGMDCAHETERNGNPQTLVVRKTTSQCDAALDAWWERRHHAEQQLEAFDQTRLQAVLGDRFDEITSMNSLNRQEPTPISIPALWTSQQHTTIPSILSSPTDPPSADAFYPAASPSTWTPVDSSRTTTCAPRQPPKRSVREISRSISESARLRAITVPSPNHGEKRKRIDIVDITNDD